MNYQEQKILGLPRAWFAILCGALFYGYQFILRVSPNVMHDDLMRHFGIDAGMFGSIVSCYYWAYGGVQIPLGIALDRFGAGKLLSVAALICAVSCVLLSFTTNAYVAAMAMFLMGFGSASGFLGSIKLGTTWFPPQHLAKVIAVVLIFGTLGASLGGSPLSIFIDAVTWQVALWCLGGVGLFISLITYLVVGTVPAPLHHEPSENIFAGLKEIIKNPQAWYTAAYSMFMYVPIIIIGGAWGVPFIESAYGVDEKTSASFTTAMFIGAAVGSPVFAYLSDALKKRILPMALGAFLSLAFYLCILYAPGVPQMMMYVLLFAAGFAYTAKALSFASICEIMPQANSAVSVGFINTLVMSSGGAFHPIIGYLLESHWDGKVVDGVNIYSSWDYRFALSVVPICLFLSLIALRYMRETYPKKPMSEENKSIMMLSDME